MDSRLRWSVPATRKRRCPPRLHPPDLEVDPSSLLSRRPYALFLAGRFLGTLATGSQSVVIAWEVYELARRAMSLEEAAFAVGMIGLVQFLPLFALTLLAGETADRHDRRRILADLLPGPVLISTGLAGRAVLGRGLWSIFALAGLFGCARAFFQPTASALGPMLVPLWLLPRAIATNSLAAQWPASSARPSAGCSAWRRLSWATRSAPGSTPPPRASPC